MAAGHMIACMREAAAHSLASSILLCMYELQQVWGKGPLTLLGVGGGGPVAAQRGVGVHVAGAVPSCAQQGTCLKLKSVSLVDLLLEGSAY